MEEHAAAHPSPGAAGARGSAAPAGTRVCGVLENAELMVEAEREARGIRSFSAQGTQRVFSTSSHIPVRIFYFSRRSRETTFKQERAD